MNGVAALRLVLAQDADLIALVPAERIICDILPQGTLLPAIRVWKVSGAGRKTLSRSSVRHVTQRVQAEVHADTVPQAVAIMKLLVDAADSTITASIGSLSSVVIHADAEGPSGIHPVTEARMETQDFRVSYNQSR